MGFNKRYINKENLNIVKKNGLQYLINYVNKPDCLIIEDELSEKIVKIIRTNKNLLENLEKIGFIVNE